MKTSLSAAILALAVVSADAAVVTETAAIPLTTVGTLREIPLLKFNPALGTLTKIELKLEVATSATNSITFDNEGAAGNVSLSLGARIQAQTGVSLLTTAVTSPTVSTTANVGADNDAAANFLGTDAITLTGGTNAVSSANQNTAPFIAQFTAAGPNHTYPVRITSSLISTVPPTTGTSGVFGPTSRSAQTFTGRITAIYTYTPLAAIPEASTALFGTALVFGLGLRRSRRAIA